MAFKLRDYNPIILVGPSGAGKSTLINHLIKDFPDLFGFSISHTTRAPRPSEQDGVSYHFVTVEEFERLTHENKFVEFANYNGNYYGTSKQSLENVKNQNKVALLDIDMAGVIQARSVGLEAHYIYVKAPSLEELRRRLEARMDTSEEAIVRRLQIAQRENEQSETPGLIDATLVNTLLEECYENLKKLIFE